MWFLYKNTFLKFILFWFIFIFIFIHISMFNWFWYLTNQFFYKMIIFSIGFFFFFFLFCHLPKSLEKNQRRYKFWIFVYQRMSFCSLTNKKQLISEYHFGVSAFSPQKFCYITFSHLNLGNKVPLACFLFFYR